MGDVAVGVGARVLASAATTDGAPVMTGTGAGWVADRRGPAFVASMVMNAS